MTELISGTVTFLFTDIEGSTRLLKQLGPDHYGQLLADQQAIIRSAFDEYSGTEIDTQGDSFFASFPRASEAVVAVVRIQRELAAHDWPDGVEVRLRMGLHTGEPWMAEAGYVGIDVHRAARIAHAGHGGQVLLSETTTALVRDDLPAEIRLLDLGSHRLKDMPRPERLHQLLIPGLQAEFPSLRTLDFYPNNLPAQVTPFVGRESELAALKRLLLDPSVRLLTVLGAGGMGKTRLSLAAAEELQNSVLASQESRPDRFPDGIFFVPLAPLEGSESILSAISAAMGFEFFQGSDHRGQISDFLREKRLLLILDNFEHLLPEANLISDFLAAAPDLKILVTSRQKLRLRGETVLLLNGMQVPPDAEGEIFEGKSGYDGLNLFFQSARRASPSFLAKGDDLKWISLICRQVDGMPLGIELAAAWVEMLTPGEIAGEIQTSLDFLEAEHRDAPARHQSLRAVFNSTWNLLPEEERDVLVRLSVLRGGFDPAAAQAISGAGLRKLMHLSDRALLQRDLFTGRFSIHQTLRTFAEELLDASGQADAVRDVHARYFSEFMDQSNEKIYGKQQLQTLRAIELDFENVKRAWNWSIDQKNDAAINQVLDPMYVFCEWLNRYQEGEQLFQRARENLAPQGGQEPCAVWGRSLLPWYDLRTEGKGLLEDDAIIQTQAEFSLAAAQKEGDPEWMAYSLVLLGAIADDNREFERAISCYRQALELYEDIGDRYWVQLRLGLCYRKAGLSRDALSAFRGSLERGRAIEDRIKVSWSLINIGESLLFQEETGGDPDLDLVEEQWREARDGFLEIGSRVGNIWANTNLSLVSFLMGDLRQTRTLSEESLSLVKEFSLQAYGRREAHGLLATVAAFGGDYQGGRRFLHEWLSTSPDMRAAEKSIAICRPLMLLLTLPSAALIMADAGEIRGAVELIALAWTHPRNRFDLRGRWPPLDAKMVELEAQLGAVQFGLAWERGQGSDFNHAVGELNQWLDTARSSRF